MGRIRSLKPEFNSNEGLSACSCQAHLLAAALLCYADDEGYFNANPNLVRAGTCPLRKDFKNIGKFLAELEAIGYVAFISCAGKSYGRIVHFGSHQKISHPSESKIRKLLEEKAENLKVSGIFLEAARNAPEQDGNAPESFRPEQGTGIREQGAGNREQGAGGGNSGVPPEFAEAPPALRAAFLEKPGWEAKRMAVRVNEPETPSDEAQMIAMAVINIAIGSVDRWTSRVIALQADRELKAYPGDMDGIRDGMAAAWKEYVRCGEKDKLRNARAGPEKFFGDGRWRSPSLWGLKKGMRAYEGLSAA